ADTQLNLKDGRQVVLHDDFTWEYINQAVITTAKDTNKVEQSDSQIKLIPLVSASSQLAKINLNDSKNIQQLERAGVEVLLQAASYKSGQLFIPVSVTNNSPDSIVNVEVSYVLFDTQQQKLIQNEVSIWTSINRIPSTYLRPEQQKQGITLEIPVSHKDSYLLKAKITDVSTR
ncbi:MAG: DUF3157 family protein, partial [Shewanella sp.]|nr:DUF3157 family protein [Shewanella sp.]